MYSTKCLKNDYLAKASNELIWELLEGAQSVQLLVTTFQWEGIVVVEFSVFQW